jgi:hypothetical protein
MDGRSPVGRDRPVPWHDELTASSPRQQIVDCRFAIYLDAQEAFRPDKAARHQSANRCNMLDGIGLPLRIEHGGKMGKVRATLPRDDGSHGAIESWLRCLVLDEEDRHGLTLLSSARHAQ